MSHILLPRGVEALLVHRHRDVQFVQAALVVRSWFRLWVRWPSDLVRGQYLGSASLNTFLLFAGESVFPPLLCLLRGARPALLCVPVRAAAFPLLRLPLSGLCHCHPLVARSVALLPPFVREIFLENRRGSCPRPRGLQGARHFSPVVTTPGGGALGRVIS